MEDNSIDAIICDPPYNLNFMDHDWDDMKTPDGFQHWCFRWGLEALGVLKPGGYLLAFGSPRTYHRLASGLEDAGFEIRDCIQWIYGQGFPKAGNLKPANEPIVVARKPFKDTLKNNTEVYGNGLQIEASRIGESGPPSNRFNSGAKPFGGAAGEKYETTEPTEGRWPANIIFDETAAEILDEQSGFLKSGKPGRIRQAKNTGTAYGAESRKPGTEMTGYGDEGGASRFFYVAKANKKEKNAGLTELVENNRFQTRECTQCGKNVPYVGSCGCSDAKIVMRNAQPTKNSHPTVKPIELMRYLIGLVTKPGGIVLDPFLGSGTTGIAAVLDGFEFIGIDQSEEYVELSRQRIEWWKNRNGTVQEILKQAKKNGEL